jgi:hypothetical protein
MGTFAGFTMLWVDPFSGTITEADILINDGVDHNTAYTGNAALPKYEQTAYNGPTTPLVPLMLHELGHALGLAHEANKYNIMGHPSRVIHANGDYVHWHIGADATAGAATNYGWDDSVRDVSVVHWKYAGIDRDYSTHERTVLYDSHGVERPRFEYNTTHGEPRYKVRPGSVVKTEFTYEDASSQGEDATLDFYLSPNAGDLNDFAINAYDTLICSTQVSLASGDVLTLLHDVEIPASVEPKKYGLGPVLSIGSADDRPLNNATYIHIYVMDNGDVDYCTPREPCAAGQGHCDSDAECASGLECNPNAGAEFGLDAGVGVCYYPVGHGSYCSKTHPCDVGEGDCDSNAQCAAGLVCATDVGANYGFTAKTDVCEVPHVDFAVESVTINPSSPNDEDEITCSAVVKNLGNIRSPASLLWLKLGGETAGQIFSVPALDPGSTSAPFERVSSLPAGQFYCRAAADAASSVAEIDEANNRRQRWFTVTVAEPDLAVDSLTRSVANLGIYARITVSARVKNAGDGLAAASSLILVARETATGNAVKLKGFALPSLPRGQTSDTYLISFYASWGTSYTYTAEVDAGDAVSESNESNNVSSASITPMLF